jgi:hypothetical protein
LDIVILGPFSLPSPLTASFLPSSILPEPLNLLPSVKWKSTLQGAGRGPRKDSRDGGPVCFKEMLLLKHKQEELVKTPYYQIGGVSSKSQCNKGKAFPDSLCLFLIIILRE